MLHILVIKIFRIMDIKSIISNITISRDLICTILVSLITFLILRTAHFVYIRKKRFQIFKYYGIPGPEPNLLDGSWIEYHRHNDKLDMDVRLSKKFGKVYGVFFGDEPNLIVTDLEMIKKIFVEKNGAFRERGKVVLDLPISHGLLYAKRDRWRALRNMLAPSFAKFHRLEGSSGRQIEITIQNLVDYIEKKVNLSEIKGEIAQLDILSLMKASSLHLISSMAVRLPDVQVKEAEKNVEAFDQFADKGAEGLIVLPVIIPFFKGILSFLIKHLEYSEIVTKLYATLNATIDQGLAKLRRRKRRRGSRKGSMHNKAPGEEQIIDSMIRLHHENRLSRIELIGTAEIILYAGYETTSTTLAYAFWIIAKHLDIQERLRQEIKVYGIESNYLRLVIEETLRLYPAAPYITTRLATRTINVNGWVIPEGTKVLYNSYLIHRNPEIWDDPESFNPDRFLNKANIHTCAYAPFGLGERRCMAYQLAMLEMKMIICSVLVRYRLLLKGPQVLKLKASGFVTTKSTEKLILGIERLE